MALRFDGRVVIVTGAGGGLGKQYATYFASKGAKVVVNDLGGAMNGAGGGSTRAAQVVVDEITKNGGTAVANYDSVEFGEKIVETAMKAFGRVDIVINNAGILRDISFQRMQDTDWDLVNKVHVYGAYKVTKAAWKVMQDQKFGRIINTASVGERGIIAGVYFKFGFDRLKRLISWHSGMLARPPFNEAPNDNEYPRVTSAKSTTLPQRWRSTGLTNSFRVSPMKGAKYNIQACTIAPMAASRMTETIMKDEESLRLLDPANVVPLVGWLTHETCKENGALFESGGGWIARLRRERSQGVQVNPTVNFTPAAVASLIAKVNDFTNPEYPANITDFAEKRALTVALAKPPLPKPAKELRFDGRVAIVTGAGNGVGRAHAHLFAKLGAKVVVNDLGGSVAGVGSSTAAAQKVVDEITAFGGVAVANYDSVVDAGEKIVDTAIKGEDGTFGRVDIIVNNAGISFANSIAIEGQKDNILCNTICPSAGTRMIATIPGRDMSAANANKPDYVSPLVAYLCHESSKETKGIFEVGAGWIAKVRWQRTGGVYFPQGQLTIENIAKAMPQISNFNDGKATNPTAGHETMIAIQTAATEYKEKAKL
ncbi:hypothetical protein HDU93_009749 [Gonapodya sp. JEL0774]|nr:hypothetical protein HDU93_009749 [Gonapodya sp. JEL0774]